MKAMKNFVQIISRKFYNKPRYRGMYAVQEGDRAGGFLIYIKEYNLGASYAFLFVPHPMEAVYFTKDEIEKGIKFNTLDFVELLPKEVYEVCRANFAYYAEQEGLVYESKKPNNRRH